MSKSKNQVIAYVTPEIKEMIKNLSKADLCSESQIVLKILNGFYKDLASQKNG